MLNSFYSGVSGLKGFQTKLDVIGNNIANVNTAGFKKSRVVFQDFFNQNFSHAVAPTTNPVRGGVNPVQVGLGSRVAAIDTVHSAGNPSTTNIGTDLMINGDSFFIVVPDGDPALLTENQHLTRAGNFQLDTDGFLVNTNGYYVLGVTQDSAGKAIPQKIQINYDERAGLPFTSFSIDFNGNIAVVDEDGNSGKLAYNKTDGYYLSGPADPVEDILSIATAVVTNPGGLQKTGNSLYKQTANSGAIVVDRIVNNNGGQILSGALEMSNVDLTDEFTEMIVAQRGFQANAKTVTTAGTILDEILNLKR